MNVTDTSRAAFEAIQPIAPAVLDQVYDAIRMMGDEGLTTNECAALLDIDKGTVQPRTSELRDSGKIMDSGLRRLNDSGKKAIVWKVAA